MHSINEKNYDNGSMNNVNFLKVSLCKIEIKNCLNNGSTSTCTLVISNKVFVKFAFRIDDGENHHNIDTSIFRCFRIRSVCFFSEPFECYCLSGVFIFMLSNVLCRRSLGFLTHILNIHFTLKSTE